MFSIKNIDKKIRMKIKLAIDNLSIIENVLEIENILVNDFLKQNDINQSPFKIQSNYNLSLINTLEELEYAFELLIDEHEKNQNGVVFTPFYVVDEIINSVLINEKSSDIINKKIIDPACGCGAFLRGALIKIKEISGIKYKEIIEKCIYGIDINNDNIRRTKIILTLQCILEKEDYENIKFNLFLENSLEQNLNDICNVKSGFDYIIGNPPYANSHDLNNQTIELIKKNFKTTKKGNANIFYAFIEQSMKFLNNEGCLGFIVPNNFLKIKAAEDLRKYLIDNNYVDQIIDFKHNTIFSPIRTYNCIIYLKNRDLCNETFKYSIIEKTENIALALKNKKFNIMDINKLDINGWNLLDKNTLENIKKIETCGINIKTLIKTGIATLKDEVYILDGYDEKNKVFYKNFNGIKYIIEPELVKKLYKISDITKDEPINKAEKYIIFPYSKINNKYKIIEEDELKKYKSTYLYLSHRKFDLASRSSSKNIKLKWYEYGRSQGLNKFGSKLFYPTFSDKPKFILMEDEDTLFCNGYAIFKDDLMSLSLLQKILNSDIMKYYVDNTSYSIEGGYFCYQKKYIQNFSIPEFTENEIKYLNKAEDIKNINNFLIKKYNLKNL